MVAYATERARRARATGANATLEAPPAGALFWIAWIVLGIGIGLAVHFYLAHQADERGGWRAVVDERLLARCDEHVRRGERLVRDWSMPTWVRPPRLHLEPADWRTGFLRADREREIPFELTEDLRQTMPQALLRDLYRPVREERWVERELVEGSGRADGVAVMQEVREARRPPPLVRVGSVLRAVREHQAWRRALVSEPWRPAKRDDEPR